MHEKFGEVRPCGFRVMRVDSQTDSQTYEQTDILITMQSYKEVRYHPWAHASAKRRQKTKLRHSVVNMIHGNKLDELRGDGHSGLVSGSGIGNQTVSVDPKFDGFADSLESDSDLSFVA